MSKYKWNVLLTQNEQYYLTGLLHLTIHTYKGFFFYYESGDISLEV